MKNVLLTTPLFFTFIALFCASFLRAQEVPIINYTVGSDGVVQLEVNSTVDKYYVLEVRHHPDSSFIHQVSLTLGESGTTQITEPLGAYPVDHYRVLEYSRFSPADTDNDGVDDMTEYTNIPTVHPLNSADPVSMINGIVSIDSVSTFNALSLKEDLILDGKEFVKFAITNFNSSHPQVYFVNMNTHFLHAEFASATGVELLSADVIKGQVIYHPTAVSENGTLGTYTINYSNAESKPFHIVQRTQELLAANMPFLNNNLSYFVYEDHEDDYNNELSLYQNSRVSALFEANVYAGIDYWGLNQKEGYGFFRHMTLNDVPGPRDIVLYDALPNSLPRVGGVITSIVQTPLSHVNLRAIQDNIPNAFIRDPLTIDTIADLLDHYIYFNVGQSSYEIREASIQEVNDWYENIRPNQEQTPPLNLDYTAILPLDSIEFNMYDGFGAKCTNVATMRTFGFDVGTIPDGFGIPFYFYREFMLYNDFFTQAELMINDPGFMSDRDIRDDMLDDFRDDIEDANMPQWMMDQLADMQTSFPSGTAIRCRSSTNNEDLAGFSGAGLYDSKTHNTNEGHISKTIKEVFASLWNLRAFEERDFYRIDHFVASMGVLCHPNFVDEKVNGVGVSADPIYKTDSTFYLNSQLGEFLITNPNNNSTPEEILLQQYPTDDDEPLIIQYSDLVPDDSLLLTTAQMAQLRDYLSVIHDEFEKLYFAYFNSTFAMDIEYKITASDQLVIKQARPWVQYVPRERPPGEKLCEFLISPNPARSEIQLDCIECGITSLRIFDITGKQVTEVFIDPNTPESISIAHLYSGAYVIRGFINGRLCGTKKFIKL